MNAFLKETYDGNLYFEASNDGSSYTEVFLVEDEIHEGWNYYEFEDDDILSYQHYRLRGTAAGACNVGELVLFGVETIDNTDSTYSCNPIIHVGDSAHELTT
mmetsp:Transcript_29266/g.28412  ORF Transcript_29266/g.28412 Transcript_29266/m.28412 type:complete len:102 (-) Transcript_29266:5388-5693(-)